jgi:hypothetical protein
MDWASGRSHKHSMYTKYILTSPLNDLNPCSEPWSELDVLLTSYGCTLTHQQSSKDAPDINTLTCVPFPAIASELELSEIRYTKRSSSSIRPEP